MHLQLTEILYLFWKGSGLRTVLATYPTVYLSILPISLCQEDNMMAHEVLLSMAERIPLNSVAELLLISVGSRPFGRSFLI